MNKTILHTLLFICISAGISFAQTNAKDLLRQRMNNPLLKAEGTLTGEGVCWHAAYDMGKFLNAYRSTQNTEYLDAAVEYFDALVDKMHLSPDGYKGWVGPFIYDENYICDVHIGDAILVNHMLEFSETVLKHKDQNLVKKYEAKANGYLALAKKHLIEKWDRRGTWHEDGPYGAYVSWDRYMTPDNLNEWRVLPVTKSILSLPFNKQNSLAISCLRIYRITGEEPYREKALKIFNFMKSRMCLFEDHYVWNYWEPFGPWDIDESSPNTLRHWVNVHPYRNYQAGEIHEIAEAYHSGLTFSKEDIQRIVNTNIKVMWNGNKEKPEWRNSNYAVQMAALGEIPVYSSSEEGPAGTLWTGLMDFDATVRELAHARIDTPPSYDREHPELPVTELPAPFHSSRYFTMVAMIPAAATKETPSNLISLTRVDGPVNIELYSSDGQKKIKDIRKVDPNSNSKDKEGFLIVPLEQKDVPPGDYRVRWTLKDDFREFPIQVQ